MVTRAESRGYALDLGPPSAYGWLARNAERFHFIQRYPHEAWHYELSLAPFALNGAFDRFAVRYAEVHSIEPVTRSR